MPLRRLLPQGIGVALTTALLFLGTGVSAQVRVIDEGAFDVRLSGVPAGVEEFSIRRSGSESNPQIIATAEITISEPEGDVHFRPALQVVGRDMRVSAYQQKISGAWVEDIFLTAEDGRFLTRSRTDAGEREREFRAPAGTLVLESQVAHHYHFLANAPISLGSMVSFVVPREGRQESLRFSEVGPETIDIGGTAVPTTRLRLGAEGSGRTIWIDSEGRVMQVEDPASGYSAKRREVPSAPE